MRCQHRSARRHGEAQDSFCGFCGPVLWFQRNISKPLPSLSVARVHRFQSAVPSGVLCAIEVGGASRRVESIAIYADVGGRDRDQASVAVARRKPGSMRRALARSRPATSPAPSSAANGVCPASAPGAQYAYHA